MIRFRIDDETRLSLSHKLHEEANAAFQAYKIKPDAKPLTEKQFYIEHYPQCIQVRPYAFIGYEEFVRLYNTDKIVSCTRRADGIALHLSQIALKDADAAYQYCIAKLDEKKTGCGHQWITLKSAQGTRAEHRYVRWQPEIFSAAQSLKKQAPTSP